MKSPKKASYFAREAGSAAARRAGVPIWENAYSSSRSTIAAVFLGERAWLRGKPFTIRGIGSMG